MTLRVNIIANYASQIYITAVSIVMVPLYIRYMGAEAYGLVAFFAMLQVLFNLLDMGLSSTVARESARFNGGATSALDYRRLVRALEGVFAAVALLGGLLLLVLARPIAGHWLNANQLPLTQITSSLQLMAAIVALRWMCGLYRGVISGAERLVWLSSFNSILATTRFVLILPILMYVSSSPLTFFFFQLGVTALEFVGLALMAYRIMPNIPQSKSQTIRWEWAPLKPLLKFSLSIALTTSMWVILTQTDKIIISGIVSLVEYGYFTLAVLVAGGVTLVSGPITGAIAPRLSRLHAESLNKEILDVYKSATRLVAAVGGVVATTLVFGAKNVMFAWTGDELIASHVAPILKLYAAGNGFMILAGLPFCLQYALGNLRLHLVGSVLFTIFLLPAIILGAKGFGAVGAGYAWLILNSCWFLIWTYVVHKRLFAGLHRHWITTCIAKEVVPVLTVTYLISLLNLHSESRLGSLGYVMVLIAAALSISPFFLGYLKKMIPIMEFK